MAPAEGAWSPRGRRERLQATPREGEVSLVWHTHRDRPVVPVSAAVTWGRWRVGTDETF